MWSFVSSIIFGSLLSPSTRRMSADNIAPATSVPKYRITPTPRNARATVNISPAGERGNTSRKPIVVTVIAVM